MTKIKLFILLALTLIFNQACYAKPSQHVEKSRLSLMNYGLAYCMKEQTVDKESNAYLDYSKAIGIYFNNGNHSNPNVSQKIETYIKTHTKSYNFKRFKGNNSLFSCLESYNSSEYKMVIKQQDAFITPK